ncbi:hypothetical protein BDD30_2876 [Photorhabdus asymbiotica]|uniref:Secreted peptide n=1 Tax=Photorhabdus asymbiotica TaxID=291112 RepID=A0ABX9SKJ0_9GAMM|nr:hypothetical protein BDD30_2876 [Photorhabdus asymbiotica]
MGGYPILSFIPFILQVTALLAAFTHPSHIVIYAPGDSFTCRRAATRNLLGIGLLMIQIILLNHHRNDNLHHE